MSFEEFEMTPTSATSSARNGSLKVSLNNASDQNMVHGEATMVSQLLVNTEKQYRCKYCKKLIHGKYVLMHLKMCHGIDLGSWKLHKVLRHYERLEMMAGGNNA